MIYRELHPAEFESARELFTRVFTQEASQSWWHWKYRGKGLVDAIQIGAFDSSSVLCAHAGALVTEVQQESTRSAVGWKARHLGSVAERPKVMIQICDVMVSDERRGQRPSGFIYRDLMQSMAQHLSRRWPEGFAYGFPGMRPHRLGERLGFYQPIASYGVSPWTPIEGTLQPLAWARLYEWINEEGLRNSRSSARATHQIGLRRDQRYLSWRYEKHPKESYECWGVYKRSWLRKKLVGWLVCKPWSATQRLVVDGWTNDVGLISSNPVMDATTAGPWLIWARLKGTHSSPIVATQFRYPGDFELGHGLQDASSPMQAELRGDRVPFTAGDTDVF